MATLTHPFTGAQADVPDALVDRYVADGWAKGSAVGGAAPEGDQPKGNASRDEWAAYADSLGVEYAEDAKRDDIKAAVGAASENE